MRIIYRSAVILLASLLCLTLASPALASTEPAPDLFVQTEPAEASKEAEETALPTSGDASGEQPDADMEQAAETEDVFTAAPSTDGAVLPNAFLSARILRFLTGTLPASELPELPADENGMLQVTAAEAAAYLPAGGGETPVDPDPPDDPPVEPEAKPLKIGLLVHETGWFSGVDRPLISEFNAMVDYINGSGGWQVGNTVYTLEPVFADGQSDDAALRAAAMSLVDAGVKFVVETNDFWAFTCADVFENAGVLHASTYCASNNIPYLTPDNPLAFTGSNGSIGDWETCLAALKEHYPFVRTVAYVNDDNGSTDETYALLEEMAAKNGLKMIGQVIYPGDTVDYTAYAAMVASTGADAFIGSGSPDAYGALLKALRAQGSDMVMACAQGKPVSMIMEYAGLGACNNGFTLGASHRMSDAELNTGIYNALVEIVREKYGDEAADTFDGAAANTLYIILQMMKRAGSVESADVAAAWEAGGEVETIYGTGTIGGTATYGVANHAVCHPRPVSLMDPDAEYGWRFAGWSCGDLP